MDLAEFVLARVAADEAVVKAEPRWLCHGSELNTQFGDFGDSERFMIEITADRVLSESKAKRAMVAEFQRLAEIEKRGDLTHFGKGGYGVALSTLLLLAQPYADHEQFQEEWRA